jgi:hypothetical protein
MKHILLFCFLTVLTQFVYAQTPSVPPRDSGKTVERVQTPTVVRKVAIFPYATISANFQSGQAFPKSAQGIGYGFGIAFDLTEEKQPMGFYFDLAYQDMRAHANDGGCKPIHPDDSISVSVPVDHYFSYALVEGFLKLQGEKSNGYFLIGASMGIATTERTVKRGEGDPVFSDWSASNFANSFRLDLRAGLGVKLFNLSGHPVVFEARFGYPITAAITDYADYCNGNGEHGSWRVLSLQGNIGIRL